MSAPPKAAIAGPGVTEFVRGDASLGCWLVNSKEAARHVQHNVGAAAHRNNVRILRYRRLTAVQDEPPAVLYVVLVEKGVDKVNNPA